MREQNTGNIDIIALHIALPRRLYTAEFDRLLFEAQKKHSTKIQITLSDSMSDYQQLLDNEFLNNHHIDYALIPSERADSYQKQSLALTIDQSLRGIFHKSFYDRFTDPQATYIPFAIDPWLTVIKQ